MKKIMFVCHGNICRSPMAEFIFRDMVKRRHLEDSFSVSSCATSTEEIWGDIGNPVYPPAREELKKHGISCEGKRAVQLKKSDYDKYDLLLAADSANVRNMTRIAGGDPEGKLRLLLDYAGETRDVADPWYTGNFDHTWADVYNGCKALLSVL